MLTHGNMTLYTYLQKQASTHHNKSFIVYNDEDISYDDMLKRANKTARWLMGNGIKKNDKIAIMCKNSVAFYDLWFGCAAIGAILVPINTASTVRELAYLLTHSDSSGFLYDPSLLNPHHFEMLDTLNLLFYEDISSNRYHSVDNRDVKCDVQPNDVCTMMYTSGTTALPKGVLITHENYLFAGHSSVLYQQLTPEDRYLIFLPLFHVNSQYYTSMAMFVVGGTIILFETFSASTFWDDVRRLKPTVSSFVATIIKILLELPEHRLDNQHSIRQVGYGLFVTQNDILAFEKRFGIRLFQWYGMTESITTNIVTPLYERMPADPKTKILALGKPALGHEIKIVDEHFDEVPPYVTGQIIIKSPSLMKGYYKNEEETSKTIRQGWLHTGDNGYRNEEGSIWFVDRNKDFIKRAGENISSLEIENILSNYPGILDCAVIGIPDNLREESIVAFLSTDGTEIKIEELKKYCEEQLSYFKIPQEFKIVQTFPRTSIGKIQKNVLRKEYLEMKTSQQTEKE